MNVTRRIKLSLLSLINLFMFASAVCAQGVIVPRPCPPPRCVAPRRPPIVAQLPRALPIKSIEFTTRIADQVATTHVEQVFRNDTDQTLEGTFFFPIPDQASVSEFAIWENGKRLVGEVRSREEARRIYDEIVRRQRDPGLLEYAGRNLLQASVFPIPPRSDKRLELTYTQVLAGETATVGFRYPLGTGKNLQRIERVTGRVEIEAASVPRNVYSPTHRIDVANRGERRATVTFDKAEAGSPARDFQLFYTLSGEDFARTLLTHREPGKDGYFLFMLSPPDDGEQVERLPKDVVFVLDTSGSMAEEGKMTKARAALLFGLRTLAPGDRYNVVNFAGEEHLMTNGLIEADDAGRARGIAHVERLRPVGGTNINAALQAAHDIHKRTASGERLRLIVFLTDGLPTVGETNVERIISNSRASRAAGVRLFTFGVGYDVNTILLDRLAADGGGVADYVEPREDIEIKVSNFFSKISYPVLADLKLDTGGVEVDLMYPRDLPDLFRGTQLIVIGRYRNPVDVTGATWRIEGRTGDRRREFAHTNLSFKLEESKHDFLPRLWATRRVGWLVDQIRANGEARELRDEVVDLGTRYGIVTPYTSYLAIDGAASEALTVERRDQAAALPVNGRAGSMNSNMNTAPSRPSARRVAPQASAAPVGTSTGAGAVAISKRARTQQEAVTDDDEVMGVDTRRVAGKTFYLRGGVWTDAEYKPDARVPETKIRFASEEYYALVRREPRLAEYLALGERVIVVLDSRVYIVE